MRAKVLRDPLVQYYQSLNWYGNIDELAALVRGGAVTPSKLFTNHNALGQLTNHNTFRFSEGGPSSNLERIEPFVPGWGERYCNNVNYVKSNAIFLNHQAWEHLLVHPQNKIQNQHFVKEHNRTLLRGGGSTVLLPTFFKTYYCVCSRRKTLIQVWNNLRVSKW